MALVNSYRSSVTMGSDDKSSSNSHSPEKAEGICANFLPPAYRYDEAPVYTTSSGAPVGDPESSMRVGQNGPLLLQDFHLIDLLAHFDRERVPERVVHAKGAGAYGEFQVTDSVEDLVRCRSSSWPFPSSIRAAD
jgi:hypothetical protein